MVQEGGWVDVIGGADLHVLARGHLRIDEFEPMVGSWRGHLVSVRAAPGEAELISGGYFLGFGRRPEERLVRLEVDREDIHVHGDDGVLPTVLTERTEGT
jgi:hypothetical protein